MPRHFIAWQPAIADPALEIYAVQVDQEEDLVAMLDGEFRLTKGEALYMVEEGEALFYLDGEAGNPTSLRARLAACVASTDRLLES